MYKISIIINFKNTDKTLLETLKSLTTQNIGFENLEIILVGSANNNWANIDAFTKDHDNIYSYKIKKNQEINYKNIALKYTTADFVMFLNENQILYPDSCENLYNIITENQADLVSGNFIYKYKNTFRTNEWNQIPLKKGFYELTQIQDNYELLELPHSLGSKIFNKNFLIDKDIKFKNKSISDLIFITETLTKANKIIFFNKPLLKQISKNNLIFENTNVSIITLINDLEEYYRELKEKSKESSKFILKYVEEIMKKLCSNNLSKENTLNICVKLTYLIQEYNTYNFQNTKKIKILFKLIANKQYNDAIQLIEILKTKNNFNNNLLLSKDIILLFYGFDSDIGGLAKAVFNRANLLSQKGHNIILINTDPYTDNFIGEHYNNYSYIEKKYRKLNFIHKNVKFYNILEYYKQKNNLYDGNGLQIEIKLNKTIQNTENHIILKIKDEDEIKSFNYYNLNEFDETEINIIKEIFSDPVPKNITNIIKSELFNKNIVKTEHYVKNKLFIESIKGKNSKTIKEYLYTDEGFNYLKLEKNEKNQMKYTLYDAHTLSEITFNKYKEFCDYFVKEMCLICNEKPFLINDCSGPIPSFNNVPHEMAYKIANIHSNPYLEPTYRYGSPRRVMSALKCVNELDALVALTETEKNDFIKEFKIDNIFAIPNLIDFKEILDLNNKKFNVDPNKISIFARISPEKNLEDLIKAFKVVVSKHPNAKLHIYGRAFTVGEKRALKSLEQIIDELQIEKNIVFRGHIDNAYDEMRTSLATMLVSHIEGLPMVIIESMANKTPVISYDINYGPKDVITTGKDGFIVEKYNIEKLAEKINFMLENPEIAIEMGEKAQQSIFEQFNLDKIYKKWTLVFQEAYINSIFREKYSNYLSREHLKHSNYIKKLIEKQTKNLKENSQIISTKNTEIENKQITHEKQKNIILEQEKNIQKHKQELENKQITHEKQKNIILEQEKNIQKHKQELKNKQELNKKLNDIITKQSQIIEKQEKFLQTQGYDLEKTFSDSLTNLKTTLEYTQLLSNPKKKVTFLLPYLYIIFKHKNIIENIKFYRKITKSNWLNIGYYLNSNPDIKRKKWCKILTPETHYTCHGFDEKRLPYPNYKNNQTKKEIIRGSE